MEVNSVFFQCCKDYANSCTVSSRTERERESDVLRVLFNTLGRTNSALLAYRVLISGCTRQLAIYVVAALLSSCLYNYVWGPSQFGE